MSRNKAEKKLRLLDLRRKIEKLYESNERHSNNVSNIKRRNIIKKKHAIDLTTNNKDVISK